MEAPLHAAACSLLKQAQCGIDFYFLLTGFNAARRDLLLRSLDLAKKDYTCVFLDEPESTGISGRISGGMLAGLRPFHGNLTPYYRLLLPELVPADRLLYLDSDTICSADVSPFAELAMEHPSGFVQQGVTGGYIERAFFASIGLPPETAAFNSGVMLFDAAAWRKQKLTSYILELSRKHQEYDQTALIAMSAGNFERLHPRYNIPLYTSSPLPDIQANPGIYHFVGSPKPWDIGGRQFHRSFSIYAAALAETAIQRHASGYASLAQWKRAYKVRGGYARRLLTLMKRR